MNFIKKKKYILLYCLIAIVFSVITSLDGGDFDVYLDAANKLWKRQNIYTAPLCKGLQYYYSPFFAVCLMPFVNSPFAIEVIWSLLSFCFLYNTFMILQREFNFLILSKKQTQLWVTFAVVLAIQFITYNIAMLQVTLFLLWVSVKAYYLVNHNKHISAGILLGLIINIKLMPIIILPYFIYKGYFKMLSATLCSCILFLVVPSLFIGLNYNLFLLNAWWQIINPQNNEHLFEFITQLHSLSALIPAYFTNNTDDVSNSINLINLSVRSTELALNSVRLVLMTLSLVYFKHLPFIKQAHSIKQFWQFAYFLMLVPILAPHQQKYAFIFALPLIMYLLYFYITTIHTKQTSVYKLFFIVFILAMLFYSPLYGSNILGEKIFLLSQQYKCLTLATLCLIPISLYCNPNKLVALKP